MLTEAERTDTRRYLGYSVHGSDPSGNMGWQFYQIAGSLEWRLTNLSDSEVVVLRKYLATLGVLEQAIPGTGAGLETGSAAGWVRNPAELSERIRLFDDWRRRLVAFLGVPAGPALRTSGNSVGIVV